MGIHFAEISIAATDPQSDPGFSDFLNGKDPKKNSSTTPEGCDDQKSRVDGDLSDCLGAAKPVKVTDKIIFSYPDFGKEVQLNDPDEIDIHRSNINRFEELGQRFIKFLSGVVVLITILVFMIGAGFWIFSAGNESLVERGKDMMIYSTIGILMTLGAYIIVKLAQVILYALGT